MEKEWDEQKSLLVNYIVLILLDGREVTLSSISKLKFAEITITTTEKSIPPFSISLKTQLGTLLRAQDRLSTTFSKVVPVVNILSRGSVSGKSVENNLNYLI